MTKAGPAVRRAVRAANQARRARLFQKPPEMGLGWSVERLS